MEKKKKRTHPIEQFGGAPWVGNESVPMGKLEEPTVLEKVARGATIGDPTNSYTVERAGLRMLAEELMRIERAKQAARDISKAKSRPAPRPNRVSVDAQGRRYTPGVSKGSTEQRLQPTWEMRYPGGNRA